MDAVAGRKGESFPCLYHPLQLFAINAPLMADLESGQFAGGTPPPDCGCGNPEILGHLFYRQQPLTHTTNSLDQTTGDIIVQYARL